MADLTDEQRDTLEALTDAQLLAAVEARKTKRISTAVNALNALTDEAEAAEAVKLCRWRVRVQQTRKAHVVEREVPRE